MMLKSEVAELRYEVAELSSGELRLTFTTARDFIQAVNSNFRSVLLLPRFRDIIIFVLCTGSFSIPQSYSG